MAHLLQIFISVLTISILSEAKYGVEHNTHIVVLTYPPIPEKISLKCSHYPPKDAPIHWEKDGKKIGNDRQLNITISAPLDAGNFTCWTGTKLLSQHLVFIEKKTAKGGIAEPMLKELEVPETYIKCMANSYSGNFTCLWMVEDSNPDLNFTINIENGDHTLRRIICDDPVRTSVEENSKYTVSCRKENSCPPTEENKPITFMLKVVYQFVLERHNSSFFIKDIIMPDASECQTVKRDRTVELTWKYPKTWSKPAPYFGLKYQIERVQYPKRGSVTECSVCEVDDTTWLKNGSTLTCYLQSRRDERFRIRSKDWYIKNAPWSHWSEPCRGSFQRDDKTPSCNQKVETCKCQKN